MPIKLNLKGKTFNNLLVIAEAPSKKGRSYWLCKNIITGKQTVVRGTHLNSGNTKGTECITKEKHLKKIKVLKPKYLKKFKTVWKDMHRRCYDLRVDSYKFYGGSDNPTSVCWEWHKDNPEGFTNFYNDMYQSYEVAKDKYGTVHLDKDIKIPGNRVYCKDACMWVKPLDNLRAKSKSNYKGIITEDKVRYIRAERNKGRSYPSIAKELSVSVGCVYAIANYITWKYII